MVLKSSASALICQQYQSAKSITLSITVPGWLRNETVAIGHASIIMSILDINVTDSDI